MTGFSQHGPDDAVTPTPAQPSDHSEGPAARTQPRTGQDEQSGMPGGESRGRGGTGRPAGGRWRRSGEDGDGALRGLLDGGRSKISLSSAMRARDVARPSIEDLAEAERVIADRIAADRARAARPAIRRAPGMWKRPPRPAPPGHPASGADPGPT